jgi:hypothetical protein
MIRHRNVFVGAALALALVAGPIYAYNIGASNWSTNVVTFYANPDNPGTTVESAEEALKQAMAAWGEQSSANFRIVYGGRVYDTNIGYDQRNVTIFRNEVDGGYLARTYAWWSGGTLLDADVIFFHPYPMYGAYDVCPGVGYYIQDVATHEYGHAIGLDHSDVGDATMYGGYTGCSMEQRTLAADDIAGVEHLYPGGGGSNTAPRVSISSPGNNSSVVDGSNISFAVSAQDDQDGNLAGNVSWASSISGWIGSGTNFWRTLPLGTHVITASVTDSGGLSSEARVSISVVSAADPTPTPSEPTLKVRTSRQKGQRTANLTWSNLSAGFIVVLRNDAAVYSGANGLSYTDSVGGKGGGSFTYKVCDTAYTVCTNAAVASF